MVIGGRSIFLGAAMMVASVIGPLSTAFGQAKDANVRIPSMSVRHLLANKEKYEGRVVKVGGYLSVQFEGNVIFQNRDDYRQLDTERSIWMRFLNDADYAGAEKYHESFGYVVGRFHGEGCQGHFCLFPGSIHVMRGPMRK